MVVPPVGKRIFLRVVSTIPTVMRGMTTAVATVKKSGLWPFKKSAVGGKKTAAYWTPLFGSPLGTSVSLCSCASADVDVAVGRLSMSLSGDVDVVVGRRATLWGITALLTDWVTDMTHVMLFSAIMCSTVGVAARQQTVIPTLAIIIAGSYHLIRGLVPIVTWARAL
jgi:hypothetical protein